MKKHVLNVIIIMLLLVSFAVFVTAVFPNNTVIQEAPPTNKEERLVYLQDLVAAIQKGIDNRQQKIDIRAFNCDAETLKEAMTLVSFSNPLYSFYTERYGAVFSMRGTVKYVKIVYNADNKITYVTDEVTNIVATMEPSLSELEKVIWINNYICTTYTYDDSMVYNDAFAMLSYKKGACGAYTQLFSLLADEAGLNVTFAISFSMQHVWNLVQVDGQWYNIDVTWDDWPNYAYCYLTSDELMLDFHEYRRSPEDTIQFVQCTDTRYDKVLLTRE